MDRDDSRFAQFAPNELVSRLAYVIGFRDAAYRQKTVDALRLSEGDRVVEIGCGTGRNLPLLERAVGGAGTIIAVDASAAMLARARKRIARHGWANVELVHADAASYAFPSGIDGVISTYTMVVIAEYDRVIERACRALTAGKRIAVLDQKLPSGRAARLVPLVDVLSRPIEYSQMVGERRVWESVRRHAGNVRIDEFYFGFVYLAVGEIGSVSNQ
jgi:demethylmenaquinone methyltransferase/2-methoxy-6-polyprenyl-1,4-benzoquinol methylase